MAQTHKGSALLTPREVAATLRVEPSTVYRWAATGELGSVRFAGTVRIPVGELERFAGVHHLDEPEAA